MLKVVQDSEKTMPAAYKNQSTSVMWFGSKAVLGSLIVLSVANVSFGQTGIGALSRQMPNSLEKTWTLGGKIGLASSVYTFLEGKDDPRMKILDAEFKAAETIAKSLEVELPAKPEFQETKSKFGASVVHYMLKELVDKTGKQLEKKYGYRHGVMFELAVKSYVLAITYHPELDDRLTFAKMIADRAGQAGFSEKMYGPLVDSLKKQKPYAEVKQQLFSFHQEVASNLKFQREMGLLSPMRPMKKNYTLPKGFEAPGVTPHFMKSSQ